MKIVATIEARMTSSRLPGKVLLPVMGQPMLYYLISRLKTVPSLDAIVLATTTNVTDDILEEFAHQNGIACFRGSEKDVMARIIGAGESVHADVIVEITGDCPIIDPQIIEQLIRIFNANKADYVSNAHVRSYPDGMDVQVYKLSTLKKSAKMTASSLDHEHVTLHIRNHPDIFYPLHIVAPSSLHWPELGLTLDEEADYHLIKKIIEHFGLQKPLFSCQDIIYLLKNNPDWLQINAHIQRRGDT